MDLQFPLDYSSVNLDLKEECDFLTRTDYRLSENRRIIFSIRYINGSPIISYTVMSNDERKPILEGTAVPGLIFYATDDNFCVVAKKEKSYQTYVLLKYKLR